MVPLYTVERIHCVKGCLVVFRSEPSLETRTLAFSATFDATILLPRVHSGWVSRGKEGMRVEEWGSVDALARLNSTAASFAPEGGGGENAAERARSILFTRLGGRGRVRDEMNTAVIT